jgi:hypothetical protein
MTTKIQFRRGTSSQWDAAAAVVLSAGEPGFETDTRRLKVGDGVRTWAQLEYVDVEPLALADLSNVSSTSPTTGQVLKWSGSQWEPGADNSGSSGVTYTVSAETVSDGANLTLTGSDSSTDAVKIAAGSNVTVTRTDANTITIGSTASGGATSLDGLSDVVIQGTPTTGQVLKFNGANWVNDTDATSEGGGASNLDGLSDVVLSTPTVGQVLKYNGTNWINDTDSTGSGSGLTSRASLQGTSSSLAADAVGPINITGYKAYSLFQVQTSAAAWVRIYTSETARQADAARLEGTDPLPGSGVIAEVITTGAQTVIISPGVIGFNLESPVTTNIPIRVTNKTASPAAITVTLTALQIEN